MEISSEQAKVLDAIHKIASGSIPSSTTYQEDRSLQSLLAKMETSNNELIRLLRSMGATNNITDHIAYNLSMNPMVQSLFGVSDPRIMISAQNAIGDRINGILNSPDSFLTKINAAVTMSHISNAYLSNDNLLARNIKRQDIANIINYMGATGELGKDDFSRLATLTTEELYKDESASNIAKTIDAVSILKNVIGRQGPIDKLVQEISAIGNTTNDISIAREKFISWVAALSKAGSSAQELDRNISLTLSSIQTLNQAGFSPQQAASISRSAILAATIGEKNALRYGENYNIIDTVSKEINARAAVSSMSETHSLRALYLTGIQNLSPDKRSQFQKLADTGDREGMLKMIRDDNLIELYNRNLAYSDRSIDYMIEANSGSTSSLLNSSYVKNLQQGLTYEISNYLSNFNGDLSSEKYNRINTIYNKVRNGENLTQEELITLSQITPRGGEQYSQAIRTSNVSISPLEAKKLMESVVNTNAVNKIIPNSGVYAKLTDRQQQYGNAEEGFAYIQDVNKIQNILAKDFNKQTAESLILDLKNKEDFRSFHYFNDNGDIIALGKDTSGKISLRSVSSDKVKEINQQLEVNKLIESEYNKSINPENNIDTSPLITSLNNLTEAINKLLLDKDNSIHQAVRQALN